CWQMVEAWNINDPKKPEEKTYPWGQPPLGYWVYDPAGNVSVQISINPALPNVDVTTPNWWDLAPVVTSSMMASFDNYMAYFGTYTVDYAASVVTHNVVTDVLRAYTATAQARTFKFENGDLVIYATDSYLRRFKRVASFGTAK
ncbi:MAG TPA: lipocalin-like domain-containing protein, partial [Thermoanaerobaculia bacterium]|nr:lipocalin-like domain-containing protein [Thermoanaerobaculia bacterium]